MTNLQIHAIPAMTDNYFWIIHNGKDGIIVDPGEAAPVQTYLNQHHIHLSGILLTHHHADHIGGVAPLLNQMAVNPTSQPGFVAIPIPVFGSLTDLQSGRITTINRACAQGDDLFFPEFNLHFNVLEVPGHTSTHLAYYSPELSSLFCGDTLFAGGCGRLFEGTPAQMMASLQKIASLPPTTAIYCAHEYTLSNLRFAMAVEPNNAALQERYKQVEVARNQGMITVPSQLSVELQTNPFLRTDSPEIIATLQRLHKLTARCDQVAVFAALRQWKNTF